MEWENENVDKSKYFDNELLYILFHPAETNKIREKILHNKIPSVEITLNINPLLCCLYYLVHISIISPLFFRLIFSSGFELPHFMACLGLGATLYVSASIYAIDKKFIQQLALIHPFGTLFILIIEVIVLILFSNFFKKKDYQNYLIEI